MIGPRHRAALDRARRVGRDRRYGAIFDVISDVAAGVVLDVGGGTLIESSRLAGLDVDRWIVVERLADRAPASSTRASTVVADGLSLPVRTGAVDVALSIQVLEHTFEPFAMLREMVRVVRPGGTIVVVVPQTANIHDAPHHYQNVTRFWLDEAARRLGLDVAEYRPLGGAWSTIASRVVLQSATLARVPGFHDPRVRRGWRHVAAAPFMALATAIVVPIALALSAADLEEEANNHLIVLRTPAGSV